MDAKFNKLEEVLTNAKVITLQDVVLANMLNASVASMSTLYPNNIEVQKYAQRFDEITTRVTQRYESESGQS